MKVILTDLQIEQIIEAAKKELVQFLILEKRDDLQLLTPVQVTGLLNINQKTLDGLKAIPRVTLVVGKVIRYKASDVAAYICNRSSKLS